MPSMLPGFQSGGQPLISGNPFSGFAANVVGGVRVKMSNTLSGVCHVGTTTNWSSGGVTVNSGGALSSGGIGDGWELAAGQETFIPTLLFGGNLNNVKVVVAAAVSGLFRIDWRME